MLLQSADLKKIKDLLTLCNYDLQIRDKTIFEQTLELNNLYEKLKVAVDEKFSFTSNYEVVYNGTTKRLHGTSYLYQTAVFFS